MSDNGRAAAWALEEGAPDATVHAFIQWKGTEACLDFYCECGYHSHGDGLGFYAVQCPDCGACYQLTSMIAAHRFDRDDLYHDPVMMRP